MYLRLYKEHWNKALVAGERVLATGSDDATEMDAHVRVMENAAAKLGR